MTILNDILSYMIVVVDDLKVEKSSKTGDIQLDGHLGYTGFGSLAILSF